MERVMTVEEKIRRAEEIYQKRKQGETRPVTKVSVNDKKDLKLLKKMVIQMLICMAIYFIVSMIQSNQYVFSEDFLQKTNEILSYDTNFIEIYEQIKNQVMGWIQEESEQEEKQEQQPEEQSTEEQIVEEEPKEEAEQPNEAAIGGAEEKQELSQEEQDIQNVKDTTSFIKPVEGIISSSYGYRETATGSVPKNHTGTDIAANLGTKIIAATEGEVVLASEEGDYRKAFKNSNRRSKYNLCTL